MDTVGGISFSKEALANAKDEFDEIQTSIENSIKIIEESLETIERNWSGPEHNSASSDKSMAEDNLNNAKEIIGNMNGALVEISANANKVSYNG